MSSTTVDVPGPQRAAPRLMRGSGGEDAVMGKGVWAIVALGALALVGLRSLVVYRRRAHDAKADLTVSESWLAEQRSRGDDLYS
jgi:hypothetical protein